MMLANPHERILIYQDPSLAGGMVRLVRDVGGGATEVVEQHWGKPEWDLPGRPVVAFYMNPDDIEEYLGERLDAGGVN